MIGGIVEIAEEGRHLSLFRGFLKVSDDNAEIGRVPLDTITALLVTARSASISTSLMAALAEQKAVVVTIGSNWHPAALTLPCNTHFRGAGILGQQIALSQPRAKRLWQQVVTEKIANQRAILVWNGSNPDKIRELGILASRVRSGDPDNMEAQAARHYWPALMGTDFRRDTDGGGINGYLNYGYAILRAATARAVVSAGLTPGLGIFHKNQANNFALVDDLMEPYRPLVDDAVKRMAGDGDLPVLGPEQKRNLASLLQFDLRSERGMSPLVNCLHTLAQSFVAALDSSSMLDFGKLSAERDLFT